MFPSIPSLPQVPPCHDPLVVSGLPLSLEAFPLLQTLSVVPVWSHRHSSLPPPILPGCSGVLHPPGVRSRIRASSGALAVSRSQTLVFYSAILMLPLRGVFGKKHMSITVWGLALSQFPEPFAELLEQREANLKLMRYQGLMVQMLENREQLCWLHESGLSYSLWVRGKDLKLGQISLSSDI